MGNTIGLTGGEGDGEWPPMEMLLEERKKCIGFNVALNYKKMPLYIVRGEGQFLYDEVRVTCACSDAF